MAKYVKASSFSRLMTHMEEAECMFITAFRSSCSSTENAERNNQLINDINHWDLSYIKIIGGYTENEGGNDEIVENDYFYCAINDKYTPEKFAELAVMLCKKYGQDAVLVTFPVADKPRTTRSKQNIIRIDGKYYDKNGKVDKEFDNITVQNVTEYFTKVGNKKFTLYSEGEENITEPIDVYGVAGRQISNEKYCRKKDSFNEIV